MYLYALPALINAMLLLVVLLAIFYFLDEVSGIKWFLVRASTPASLLASQLALARSLPNSYTISLKRYRRPSGQHGCASQKGCEELHLGVLRPQE